MKNTRQQITRLVQSPLSACSLMLGSALAQAQPGTGSITFSPLSAQSVPTLGSAMLIMLSLLLAFIAFVALRKHRNGTIAPVVAGALVLAAVASGGSGITLLHKAHAGMGVVISNPAGETRTIFGGQYNSYYNDSGTTLRIGPVSLPEGDCPSYALEGPGACALGGELADQETCSVDCRDDEEA